MSNMDSIDIQVSASASNANAELDKLITKLNMVHTRLSRIGGKSINFGSTVKTQSNAAKTGLNNLSTSMDKTTKSTKSLASTFGTFYANFFWVIRGIKEFGNAVSTTMNYMESFNFWDVSITSAVAKEVGEADAESYAQAFMHGLADFNQKMTGFRTDTVTGDISVSNAPNLGINLTELTTFQAEIISITSSLGLCTSVSKDTSKALSMLAADMSSLKNIDLKTVMTNFQSGLIGQSRALYKYGIDITNATLQTYAYKHGIEKAVSEMTQAEKMQLRLLAILDQSKVAWGDLANTIEQPANQYRVLTNGVKNLGITIGKILMPMVSTTLPYLNAMVKALQVFAEWVAKIAGVKINVENAGEGTTDIFDGIENSADDATEAVKALKKSITTLGIDELNINDPNDDSGTTDNNPNNGGIDLSDVINKSLEEYEKAWEDAYKKMEDKSTKMANAIVEAFQKKDYKSIGTYISTGITNTLNSISWQDVYIVADQFGTGLAQFLNGTITPEGFSAIGATLAGILNTVIQTGLSLVSEFDFTNLGISLGDGINKFFQDFDTNNLAEGINTFLEGVSTFLVNTLDTIGWEDIGKKIGEFLEKIEWKEHLDNFGEVFWKIVGAAIDIEKSSFSAAPIETGIITAIGLLTWPGLGKTIADSMLRSLTITPISLSGLAITIASFSLSFAGTPSFDAIASGILAGIEDAIEILLPDWAENLLGNIVAGISVGGVAGSWLTPLGTVAGAILGGILGALNGIEIDGTSILETIFKKIFNFDTASAWFDSMIESFETAFDGKRDGWLDIGGHIFEGIVEGFLGAITSIVEPFSDMFWWFWDGICGIFGIQGPAEEMRPIGENILKGVIEGFIGAFSLMSDAMETFFNDNIKPWFTKEKWNELADGIKQGIQEKWAEVKDWWSNKVDLEEIKAKVQNFKEKVKDKWQATREYWKEKTDLSEVKAKIASYKSKLKERWNDARDYWKKKSDLKEITAKVASIKSKLKERWNDARDYWSKKTGLSQVNVKFNDFLQSLKDKWKKVTDWWDDAKSKFAELVLKIKIPKLSITYDTKDVFADVFRDLFGLKGTPKLGITWQSFQTGGFPEDGLFFANHNELVGKFTNGKNVVANNMQIVDGIKYGVREAVSEVLAPYLADIAESNREVANKEFATYIGDREIARANNRGQRSLGIQLITEF